MPESRGGTMVDRTDSLWYPTERLFRQWQAGNNWDEVIERVAAALAEQFAAGW